MWALSAVAVLVLAVIGGAAYLLLGRGGGQPAAQGGHSTAPRASRSASPAAVTHSGDLRRYLIAAPTGSHPWPSPLGTNRKLSLHQVAKLSSNSKARQQTLLDDHFTRGAVQCWIKSGTWSDMRLYQFGSAADAQAFFHQDLSAMSAATPAAGRSSVSQVPGARAFADQKPDSQGYISVLAIGVKGDVVFVADIAEHSATASLGLPKKLMREQYGKL